MTDIAAAPDSSNEMDAPLHKIDESRERQDEVASHPEELLHDQAERAAAKEEVVQQALSELKEILRKMWSARDSTSERDLSTWKTLAMSIAEDSSAFRFYVGVAGDTGTGKSSLLNALVSAKADIAPASQNGACTAAVCTFSYPKANQNEPFTAEVYLKSKETVDAELAAFFQEFSEGEERADLDGAYDSVTNGEREKFLEQLQVVRDWSGLSEQQLRDLGTNNLASDITFQCENKDELFNFERPHEGLMITLSGKSEREFLLAIKPYVGSATKAKPSGLARWPLVERVEIYVKADVLRGGIVLVDLPGEMDALEARSQVARKYYEKLDRLMVITPGDRAVDNRTAMDIIRDDQIIDMEGDGKLEDKGMCVVVTKVDQMDWQNFVLTEWHAEEISDDFPQLLESFEAKKNEKESLEEEIAEGQSQLEELDGEQHAELASELNRLGSVFGNVTETIRELDSLCLRKCIEARSRDTKERFQKYFDQIRNSPQIRSKSAPKVSTALDVFPVSSKAHRSLAKGRPEAGFHDKVSTGVDNLMEWIVQGSLSKREEHADNIIHRSHVIFDAIDWWATTNEVCGALKLPEAENARITDVMNEMRSRLKGNLQRLTKNMGVRIDRLPHIKTFDPDDKNSGLANRFVDHVDNFQKGNSGDKLHWSTYAACIRRRGGAFRTHAKPRKTHCWQARTYGFFWGPHTLSWGQTFGQKLLDKARCFDNILKNGIDSYIREISSSANLPEEYKSTFRNSAYKFENLFGEYRVEAKSAILDFKTSAKAVRLRSREQIAGGMSEAYLAAQAIKGKKKRDRQVESMHDDAEDLREVIFADVSSVIENELKTARADLKKALKNLAEKVVRQIATIDSRLVTDICSSKKQPKKTSSSSELQALKRSISTDLQEWRQIHWLPLQARLPTQVKIYMDEDWLLRGLDGDDEEPVKVKMESSDGAQRSKAEKKRAPQKKKGKDAPGAPRKKSKKTTDEGTKDLQPAVVKTESAESDIEGRTADGEED